MDPPEIALHSFVAKARLEVVAPDNRPAVLRGDITPVLSGERSTPRSSGRFGPSALPTSGRHAPPGHPAGAAIGQAAAGETAIPPP